MVWDTRLRTKISRSRFKQSKISMLISLFGLLCKCFFCDFWMCLGIKSFFQRTREIYFQDLMLF